MPRKRKRSVSPPGPAIRGGGGMDEGRNDISIQQGPGSISQSGRSNPRSHSSIHERDAMISPRQHQHHSPPHYQSSPYDQQQQQQQQRNHAYSPPPPNPSYHQTHRNSPDREEHPLHSPSNPHAPSHYNFANRAYAQQRDSGFNTFRVNPGPVAGGSNPVPPVPLPIASPLPTPSSEDPLQYRYRPHSHSQPPPAVTAASPSIPPGSSYPRLSPPLEIENEMVRRANGSGLRNNRNRGRNGGGGGGEISLSSSDDDDVPYNPATAGGRSKAMVKYLIMKAKYRYVLDEHALLSDELESLKREEHEQWTLKEVGVDEIVKSFGSDSDRFLHDRNDQHAQQYQLHNDHDSADGDMDLLRDLDKERHTFLNRDRGSFNKDRERWDTGNDVTRGRDHHAHVRPAVDLDRNGNGGRPRPRSSSRSRVESNLDSHSYPHHQSRHSYRRTPPPPPVPERQQHPPQQDTRQYIPERPDAINVFGQQDGGQRYLSPPQQYPSQSHVPHGGRGLISPPSSQQRQTRYQSPPLPSQHRTPPPPPRQYRESPSGRRNHEEGFQPHGEPRDGGVHGSNTFPVNDEQHQEREREMRNIPSSTSSSRPQRHSPHISHSSHSPPDADPNPNNRLYQPESSRERDTRPKRGRPSLEESAKERDYESPTDTRGGPSTSTNSNTTGPVPYESGGRPYSPSRGLPPRSERSITPQPAKQTPTQTQKDSIPVLDSVVRSRSRTSSVASLSHSAATRPAQVGGSPPPLRTMSLAATVNPTFSPSSSTPNPPHSIRNNTPPPPPPPPPQSNSHTIPFRLSNDSPPPPPPHVSVAVHSPLTVQQKDVTSIKEERDLHVEEEERESNDLGRRRGSGTGMDVD